MSKKRCDGLLARVDFPLYTLQTLTNRHVLVAGGGGASNTGVANGFVSICAQGIHRTIFVLIASQYVSAAAFQRKLIAYRYLARPSVKRLIVTCVRRKYSSCHIMERGLWPKR